MSLEDTVPEARHGTAGLKRVIGFSRAAMPDQKWTNEMVIAKAISSSSAEHWAVRDDLGLMKQLGVLDALTTR